MNALLAKTSSNPQTNPDSHSVHLLRLADDVKRGYTKCPIAHPKDMRSDGLSATAIMIYSSIAGVQRHEHGEFFRSNSSIAQDLLLGKSTVSRCISELNKKGYLSIWFKNGGRRMRAMTRVSRGYSPESRGVLASEEGGTHQRVPDKENNRKKTIQQTGCVVSLGSLSDSRKDRALWGGALEKLTASHGREAVVQALAVYDSYKEGSISNPAGFLVKAINGGWEPAKAKKKKKAFEPKFYKRGTY